MRVELGDVIYALADCGIDDCNTTLLVSAIGDIYSLFCRIVTHIIGILPDVHRIQQLERISIVDPELSVCTVRHEKLIEFTHVRQSLWRSGAGDAMHVAA